VSKSEPVLDSGCFSIYVGVSPDDRRGLGWLLFGEGPDVENLLVSYGADGPGSWREVGLDVHGRVVFRFPDSRFHLGDRGLFDPHTPPVGTGMAVDCADFDRAWDLPPIVPPQFRDRVAEYLGQRRRSRDIERR
jgi:hypothetical protein